MNVRIFFDFHDIFVDAKTAWHEAFLMRTNNSKVINDYDKGISKKELCQIYGLDYEGTEAIYRQRLKAIKHNIEFARLLSKSIPIELASMSGKERLFRDMDKFKLSDLFQRVYTKADIGNKKDFLQSESQKCDWILYFNHEYSRIKVDNNVIMIPIDFYGDLEELIEVGFSEHAKNKLLYNDLSKYYMSAIANDTNAETEFIKYIYETFYLGTNRRIMDCCCGVGRHSKLLALDGYKISGIDISVSQIDTAMQKNSHENIDYYIGDVRTIDLEEKNFDMAICMWTTYNYFSKDEDLKLFLMNAWKHLSNHGLFLLDSKNIPSLEKHRVYMRSRSNGRVKVDLLIIKRVIDCYQNSQYLYFIDDNGSKKFYFDEEFVRFYYLYELENLVKPYYSIVATFGGFGRESYCSNSSSRFIVILKKSI